LPARATRRSGHLIDWAVLAAEVAFDLASLGPHEGLVVGVGHRTPMWRVRHELTRALRARGLDVRVGYLWSDRSVVVWLRPPRPRSRLCPF